MDVAFIAHFRQTDRVFEHVDADGIAPIQQGQAIPLEDGYCLKIVRGELPQLIPDTSAVPAALALPATRAIPIGAHLSVPIELSSGEIYGTLCCFSRVPNQTLGERDLRMMHALAEVVALRIDEELAVTRRKQQEAREILQVLELGAPRLVFQPIYSLVSDSISCVESLSRFDVEPRRPPDVWFKAAQDAGVGFELEVRAIEKALAALQELPLGVSLSVNTSPQLALSGRLGEVLNGVELSRVVLEITEHASVHDYDALFSVLAPLRARGALLAIDDAGAGYASMRHILDLRADVIKLDMSLTRDIDKDAGRRALAKGLITFAHEIESTITAEGVETQAELDTLRALGADKVQGYFLGKPEPLEALLGARILQVRAAG
jgi:EAL domain-containing protein (putative c-di-GMP-specific phosphodiesterase class I)